MIITLRRLGPKMLPSSTAKRMDGSASCMSVIRIKIWLVKPPLQPDSIPTSVPIAAAPGTTIATTISENPRPMHQPAEDVAAQIVRPQGVVPGAAVENGRHQTRRQVKEGRIVRGQHIRQRTRQEEDQCNRPR